MRRLFRWKARLFWRGVTRSRGSLAGYSVLGILGLAWAMGVVVGCRYLFRWLDLGLPGLPEEAAAFVPAHLDLMILSFVHLAGMAILLFTAFASAFGAMYASSDLPLLFVAPLTVRQVFTLKFTEVMAGELLVVLLLTLPATLGYGLGIGVSWLFYPAAILNCFVTVFLPTALGMFLNLLAMRIIPPYRVRELGAAAGSLLGAAIYAVSQLGPRYVGHMDPQQIGEWAGRFSLTQAGYSPAYWLAQATVQAGQGSWVGFLAWFGLATAVSLGTFFLSFPLVQEAFYGGWAGSAEVRRRQRRQARTGRGTKVLRRQWIRGPIGTLAGKETRTVLRDMREWSQALYMLVVMVVMGLVPLLGRRPSPVVTGSFSLYLSLAVAFGTVWALTSVLGLGAVGREGRSWPLLRSTPLKGEQILWGKILGTLPLVTIPPLVLAPLLALLFGVRGWGLGAVAAMVLLAAAGQTAVQVVSGALYANFSASDPRKRTRGMAFLLATALTILHALVLGGSVLLMAVGAWAGPGTALRALGLALLLAGGLTFTALPVVLAGRLLDNREASLL